MGKRSEIAPFLIEQLTAAAAEQKPAAGTWQHSPYADLIYIIMPLPAGCQIILQLYAPFFIHGRGGSRRALHGLTRGTDTARGAIQDMAAHAGDP